MKVGGAAFQLLRISRKRFRSGFRRGASLAGHQGDQRVISRRRLSRQTQPRSLQISRRRLGCGESSAKSRLVSGISSSGTPTFVFRAIRRPITWESTRRVQPGLLLGGAHFSGGRIRNGALASVGGDWRENSASCPARTFVRLTNKQNLLIPHVPESNLARYEGGNGRTRTCLRFVNFRKGCVSCTGIEFCNLGGGRDQEPDDRAH